MGGEESSWKLSVFMFSSIYFVLKSPVVDMRESYLFLPVLTTQL